MSKTGGVKDDEYIYSLNIIRNIHLDTNIKKR